MATREEYNACMRPFITGSKPKEERKRDFCIGAKVCSGKATTKEEAAQLCSNRITPQATQPQPPGPCASIINMRDWVQQPGDDSVCRPCLLAPVTQWYMDVLKTTGLPDLAVELEGAVEHGEAALAAKLDEVKDRVSPEVKARLREFDCHAQLYKGEQDGR